MQNFIIYKVATGKIVKNISGYIAPSDIPEGCWFIEGIADLVNQEIDTSSSDPAEHTLIRKEVLFRPQRSDVVGVRNRLEYSPIECTSIGHPLTLDATPISVQRMTEYLDNWHIIIGSYSARVLWTLADNSEIYLDHSQLTSLRDEVKSKVALRRNVLFEHARSLLKRLNTLTPNELDVSKWP